MPRSLTSAQPPGAPGVAARPGRPALDEELFARDLAMMLQSGLTLMDGLKTLRERATGAPAVWLDDVMRRLTQGEALSQALQASAGAGTSLLACVRASELTGDLPVSLARFAANAARLRALRGRLVSALVYPAVLVSVATLVVVFLLVFVVPRFAMVLESTGKDMPLLSQWLIAFGRRLHQMPSLAWLVLGIVALWLVYELVLAVRTRRLEAWLADLGARVPGVRDIVRTFGLHQFARSAAMLVRSGVPALKAMGMCRELLHGRDRQALDGTLRAASAGAPLAASLHERALVDALGLRVLRVAEQTGELDAALERLADIHDQTLERTLDRVGRLIEPVLMLLIGLVVGGIVVLMYLPIFQLASSL